VLPDPVAGLEHPNSPARFSATFRATPPNDIDALAGFDVPATDDSCR
jgi:hypothetical protein